jgi:hypothetical protein
MKKVLFTIICLLEVFVCRGQYVKIIFDVAAVEAIVENHAVQKAELGAIAHDYKEIASYNEEISVKIGQVYLSRNKLYLSLKNVEAIKSNGKDLETIQKIITDIGKYQSQMLDYAAGNPVLLAVAAKTELELINKTLTMLDYMNTAITEEDTNLMDNAQRMNLLKTVIRDLRVMRSLAYSVCRQMKTAKRDGILKALAPELYGYPDDGSKIKDEILKNYKTRKK